MTAAAASRLLATAAVLAELDVLVALAELARMRGYCRPTVVAEPMLEIRDGRHPVLDVTIAAGAFVPNDVECGGAAGTTLLITGPNMAGKSTFIRQVALITLMAQMRQFRAGAAGDDRRGRPDIRPRRRQRRTGPRPQHVHGRDDRDGADSEHGHRAQPGDSRRDRPRHEHLRRVVAGLGGGRVPARSRSAAARCSPRITTN